MSRAGCDHRDNVSVKVNAVVYFRVMILIRQSWRWKLSLCYLPAFSNHSQSVCGQAALDELLGERDKVNARLQEILDKHSDPWE